MIERSNEFESLSPRQKAYFLDLESFLSINTQGAPSNQSLTALKQGAFLRHSRQVVYLSERWLCPSRATNRRLAPSRFIVP
jgi:hypothetical protein